MTRPVRIPALLSLLLLGPSLAASAQDTSDEATNALAGIAVQQGFRLELVASAPQVVAPVAMAFDENGRLFVAEITSPSQSRTTGRIRLLEDPEGNGTYTVSSVYAEDVPWPTSIACYDSGIFVAATPDILYLKDTKKNGIADVRRKVFSGFGDSESSARAAGRVVTGLRWGPDGRIHGLTAGIGGEITSLTSNEPFVLGHNDFSFDPRSLDFRSELGPGQSALAFDGRGRKFITDLNRPLRTPTYELAALARNPFAPGPSPFVDVVSPGTVLVQRLDVESEPKSNAAKSSSQARESTNTTTAASFSSACGTVFYAGNAYPSNYADNVFIADPVARVVHREVLRDTGLFPVAERSREWTRSEFLSSGKSDFYPTEIVNGPDGVLYVADHTQSANQGRIYRVVPNGFKQPKLTQLGKLPTSELAVLLANPNAWQHQTAARLLYERQDPAAVAPLTNMVNNSRLPFARIRALQALGTLGALNETLVLKTLKDPDARVREQGVYAAQAIFRIGPGSDEFRSQLQMLAMDPSVQVRYQLAFTLGTAARAGRTAVLAEVLFREAANPWFRSAVLSSLDLGTPELLGSLVTTPRFAAVPALQSLVPELAQMIGTRGRLEEVKAVLEFVYKTKLTPQASDELLYNVGEGLRRTRSSLMAVDQQNALQPFYDAALIMATDASAAPSVRAAATRLLGVSTYTYSTMADWLLLLLSPKETPLVQLASISTLTHQDDARVAPEILKRWQFLPPPVRQQTIIALLSRSDRAGALLAALQNRAIPLTDFTPAQLDFLRTYPAPALSQRALQLLGPVQPKKPQAMEKLKPALSLRGVASRGREVFVARCANCHWSATGPNGVPRISLAPLRAHTKEQLLSAIVEPSAQIRAEEQTQVVETKQGEYYIGLLLNENPSAVCLLQADGTPIVLPRLNIQIVRPQTWSLMPAGLESGLTTQALADLLEFCAHPE